MNKVITIDTIGVVNITTPDHKPTLKEMQKMVGGYIEPVGLVTARMTDEHIYTGAMVVNRDRRRLDLPFNAKASLLAEHTILGDVFILVGWRI